MDSINEDDRANTKAVLDKAAEILSLSPKAISNVIREISDDPYTKFLTDTWPN
jgi:hypothetical protein